MASTSFTVEDRRRLAEKAGVSEPYLYQCLTGRRDMNPAEARRIEDVTEGEIRRWHLCQKTWASIWPELKGQKDAPVTDHAGAAARRQDETVAILRRALKREGPSSSREGR